MSFDVIDVPQRSEAWLASRCGVLTASDAKHILSKGRSGGESTGRQELRVRLAVERITGRPAGSDFVNDHMRRGEELEPEALAAYEAAKGVMVTRVGFLRHQELPIGCSPDGLVDGDNGVEIKVPALHTHAGYVLGGVLPSEHKAQILHTLYVTDAEWWDFCSYDPRMPETLQTFIVRVQREDVDLGAYGEAVRRFLAEVNQQQESLTKLMGGERPEEASLRGWSVLGATA